jgi:hypothetical protein
VSRDSFQWDMGRVYLLRMAKIYLKRKNRAFRKWQFLNRRGDRTADLVRLMEIKQMVWLRAGLEKLKDNKFGTLKKSI